MHSMLKRSALAAVALLVVAGATSMTVSKADLTVKATVDVSGLPTPDAFPGGPGGQGGPGGGGPGGPGDQGGPGGGGPGGPGGFPGFGSNEKYPQTFTIYYKGSNVRTEASDGTVTIYNARKEHTYVLDTKAKTYYIRADRNRRRNGTGGGNGDGPGGQGGPGGFGPKVTSTIAVTPLDATAAENGRTIAGQHAVKSTISGDWSMSFGQRGQEGPGGGQQGPPAGFRRAMAGMMSPAHVEGSLFLSDSIALPSTDKSALSTLLDKLTAGVNTGPFGARSTIEDQLIKAGQLPLKAFISVTRTPQAPAASTDNNNQATPPAALKPVTTDFEVKSISTSDLSDDLFSVPDDYNEVDPPASPFGGGGFPGGGGGFGGPPPAN